MDENHQDNTESKLAATEDKSTPSSLSLQNQRGTDQLQNNQMEITIKQLRDRGYKVTEEYSNTGQLSKVSGEHPQRKTWWDWLQLLIIPLLIFFLGIGFTWIQNQTSLQIAKDTQEEATLKAYLDDMTTLLLDKKLGSQAVADQAASADSAVVARARTLTVLRRLTDPQRKATVVHFLHEAHLIGYYDSSNLPNRFIQNIFSLSGADLQGADLTNADLTGAYLQGADLTGADLQSAVLRGAVLNCYLPSSCTNLGRANLSKADLSGAYLSGANLTNADLSSADLSYADLSGAQVTTEQLALAKSLKGATMPDGSKHP
jgi:ribulose bisphosphate carboxylase small subunit